VKAK